MSIRTYWQGMRYWKRGAIIGILIYFPIVSYASYLVVYEIINDIHTGFEFVGLLLFVFGFPVSFLIKIIPSAKLHLSVFSQKILLSILALLNYIVLGSLAGYIIGKIKGK